MSFKFFNEQVISQIKDISKLAGIEIMKIYKTDFSVKIKSDHSPVTQADTNANNIILKGLSEFPIKYPILSEEGSTVSYKERASWKSFWLVDPLDGTKEFINKNDEFTVNIAFINNNIPVFGVVYAPVYDLIFWGGEDIGAFKAIGDEPFSTISVNSDFIEPIQIASSRSHPSEEMDLFLKQFKKYNLISMGSSLKICSVADGSVHLYPRLGPTMEWDTAASHAIVKASGGDLVEYGTKKSLLYNKQNLLNPKFIAGCMDKINNLNM